MPAAREAPSPAYLKKALGVGEGSRSASPLPGFGSSAAGGVSAFTSVADKSMVGGGRFRLRWDCSAEALGFSSAMAASYSIRPVIRVAKAPARKLRPDGWRLQRSARRLRQLARRPAETGIAATAPAPARRDLPLWRRPDNSRRCVARNA